MQPIENVTRSRLDAGQVALGLGLRMARTVEVAKAVKSCGYHWLFIDMEHGTLSVDSAAQLCVAAQDAGITPIVRVPGFEHFHSSRILDGGAQGVVIPHVDTPEMAARLVSQCRYPPLGKRSVIGGLAQTGFAAGPLGEVTKAVNDATLVVLMIESPEAVANVDAIAALPGVDVLLVGTNDLSMELGCPGQLDHPDIVSALEKVIAACNKHGKHPGLGGVYGGPLMERYIKMGMRFVLAGNDLGMMMNACKAQAAFVEGMKL